MSSNESAPPPVAPPGDTAKCSDTKERLEEVVEKACADRLFESVRSITRIGERCDDIWGFVDMMSKCGFVLIVALCMLFVRVEHHGGATALTATGVLESKAATKEMFAKLSAQLEELSKKIDALSKGKSILKDLHAELEAAAKQKQIIEEVVKRPPAEEVRAACRLIADSVNSVPVPHRFFIFPSSTEGKTPSAYDTSFAMYACLSCSSPDVFPVKSQFDEAQRRVKSALDTKARVYKENNWALHDGWEEDAERAIRAVIGTYEARCAPVA
jgi:hypothetical protein